MSAEQKTCATGNIPWRKSSYSGSGGGNCVEVSTGHSVSYVRDSKDAQSPILSVPHHQWSAFIEQLAAER